MQTTQISKNGEYIDTSLINESVTDETDHKMNGFRSMKYKFI